MIKKGKYAELFSIQAEKYILDGNNGNGSVNIARYKDMNSIFLLDTHRSIKHNIFKDVYYQLKITLLRAFWIVYMPLV